MAPADASTSGCGGCMTPTNVCMEQRDARSMSAKADQVPRFQNLKSRPWETNLQETVPFRPAQPGGLGCGPPGCGPAGSGATPTLVQLEVRYGSAKEAVRVARQQAKEDQVDKAFATYSAALDLDEQNAATCDEFGQFLLANGQLEGAECLFDRALALDPTNAEYCYRRGVVLQQRRQPVEAAEAFTNALRQDPRFVSALFNLGVAHRELGDHRSGAEDFRRILAIDPGNECAYSLLGECLAELGDNDGAVRALEEAVRLDPTNRAAQRDLQRLRQMSGQVAVVGNNWS